MHPTDALIRWKDTTNKPTLVSACVSVGWEKKKKKSQKASSLPPLQVSTGARSMKRRVQKEIRKHLTGAEQPRSLLNRGKNAIQRKIVCASSGCSEMSFDAKLLHYIKNDSEKNNKQKENGDENGGGGKSSYEATAAGKYAAHKPCLIAANLNFTSLTQSRGDSLQVMTSRAASCVVTPYIPDIFGPLRTELTLHTDTERQLIHLPSNRRPIFSDL